ncbi:MAG: hypothetical protein HW380_1282 [Magnetococcales bacterium]|nr:hypothetical protein [Magnetococcales bacterium]HIJ85125.1 DUF1640 domain-containing protein [Magnetococcales bacterium]
MATITFDTHDAIRRLKAAGFDELQAEAISSTFKDAVDTHLAELATKADLRLAISEAKAETVKWMFGVATGQAMFIIAILKMFPSH